VKLGSPSQRTGATHEDAAAKLLIQRGLTVIARNFHCKMGELDIVALGSSLHFVEVRFRGSDRFGSAAESITPTKQAKLRRTAEFFLQRHPRFRKHRAQFDVVTVSGTNYPPDINWIESPF